MAGSDSESDEVDDVVDEPNTTDPNANKETDVVFNNNDDVTRKLSEPPNLPSGRKRPLRSLSISSSLKPAAKTTNEQRFSSASSTGNVEANNEDTVVVVGEGDENAEEDDNELNGKRRGSGRDAKSDKFLLARESNISGTVRGKDDNADDDNYEGESSNRNQRASLDKSDTGKRFSDIT